jgi:hypothetical protein
MTTIQKLLKLSKQEEYVDKTPEIFAGVLGFPEGKSPEFLDAAWALFKLQRRRISVEDVEQYQRHGEAVALGIGVCESHFLDSGSFTLRTEAAKYGLTHGGDNLGYYNTPEFWNYVKEYAAFVKRYQKVIDFYANVDVIPDPELTWRNQQHIEKEYGLRPVPVVHYTTDLKWLRRYIDAGYDFIGLGGLVGADSHESRQSWLDRAFDLVCDNPQRLPCVRLHGFGVTRHSLMVRYPWWSVDSTRWAKAGAYGSILVPYKRAGSFDLLHKPYMTIVSVEAEDSRMGEPTHFCRMSKAEQRQIREWLDLIGVPFGKYDGREVIEYGVSTHPLDRRQANLGYFDRLCKALPDWPWAFQHQARKGFGVKWGK